MSTKPEPANSFDRYAPTVMDHFLNPRNTGDLPGATHRTTVENPACGDMVTLSVRVDAGKISSAKARTYGCAAAIASTSMLTEMLKGMTVDEARALRNTDVVAKLGGLPDDKINCSVVAEQAVRAIFPG